MIIEATGVAETADIESYIDQHHLQNKLRVRANLCLVDAINFTKTAPFSRAVSNQVRWADGIVVNKCDLVQPAEVESLTGVLRALNDQARLCSTSFGIECIFEKVVEKTPCAKLDHGSAFTVIVMKAEKQEIEDLFNDCQIDI